MTARPLRLALLAALLAALLVPAAARAAGDLEVAIADDAAVLKEPDADRAARTVAAWQASGIDTVRLFAEWQAIAPENDKVAPPAGFNGADPDDPGYYWEPLDRAVNLVRGAGMHVTLNITGPGPLWASREPARANRRFKPRPDLFAQFARAVALRYGPAVERYIIWNEPNQPLWLQPQFSCPTAGHCTPYSPSMYRSLVRAAVPAIRGADPRAQIVVGAISSRGGAPRSKNVTMRPLTFIRALGCVDNTLKRTRKGTCKGFRPITDVDGFAYQPHSVLRAPDEPNPNPDEASLADLPRLETTLDAVQRQGGLRKRGTGHFPLFFTEYAYQTKPPDPYAGVSLAKQSKWLQQGAYIAWKDPRVKSITQYEWRDEPLGRGTKATKYSGWQSGLLFADGRAKPSMRTFPNPFWVDLRPGSRKARLWGQVRPGDAHAVTVQRRAPGRKAWTLVRTVQTTRAGYWTFTRTVTSPTEFRYTWQPLDAYGAPSGPRMASDVMRASPGKPAPLVLAPAGATSG
jgi:Cellulase (glycosyl hydrolase family 5)